jgi:type VI secretion system protein VasD
MFTSLKAMSNYGSDTNLWRGFASMRALWMPVLLSSLITGCFGGSKESKDPMADLQRLVAQIDSSGVAAPGGTGDHPPAQGQVDYTINVSADPVINRSVAGKPLSLVLRIYQLKDKTEFSQITYSNAISRNDNDLLPKDLSVRNEWVLLPGATLDITDNLLPETRYLGVVGYFRSPDAQNWRVLVDADAVRKEGLSFVVRDCYLGSVFPKAVPLPGQGAVRSPECAAFLSTPD